MPQHRSTRSSRARLAGLLASLMLTAGSAPTVNAAGTVAFNPLAADWVAGVTQAQREPVIRELSGEQAATAWPVR